MLKKLLLVSATAATLGGPVAALAAGDAGTGEITFTGSVLDAPCTIAAGDSKMTIDLGQISNKDLTGAAGKIASTSVPIQIHLAGCTFDKDTAAVGPNPNGKLSKVGVTFTGAPADAAKGMLTNIGTAQNVSVQLMDFNNTTPINMTTPPTATSTNLQQMHNGAGNTLNFFARVALTGTTAATPGTVSSTVAYSLNYF